jgi:Peptidase family M28
MTVRMVTDTHQHGDWRAAIHELAAFERPSASDGERRAAELIAAKLQELGVPAVVERERAHGGYWWPLGLANLLSVPAAIVALARRGRLSRVLAALAGGVAAAAVWDDLEHGRRWFRRALPHRATWNVVGEAGDVAAERTVVVVAHHDAAHSGLVFHPSLGELGPRLAPRIHERSSHTVPILYGVWLGPAMICAGGLIGGRRLLRAGLTFALGSIAAMTDIGIRSVVPGANDNLTAVGVVIAVAAALRERPLKGVRVLLVSTGSEESFSEGMSAFVERHSSDLDPGRTEVLCLECLGGPRLTVLEGEGMLRMRDYSARLRDALTDAAAEAGVTVRRGIRTVTATDALIAMRAGYPAATLASGTLAKLPLNYHWPTDVPDALYWETIEAAIAVCEQFLRARA